MQTESVTIRRSRLFLLKPQRVRRARCTCIVQLWARFQVLVLREPHNQPMRACRSFCMSSSYTYPLGYHSKCSGATTQVLTHPDSGRHLGPLPVKVLQIQADTPHAYGAPYRNWYRHFFSAHTSALLFLVAICSFVTSCNLHRSRKEIHVRDSCFRFAAHHAPHRLCRHFTAHHRSNP